MEIEKVMDKIDGYLSDNTFVIVLSIEKEEYETSAIIRDEIELKIIKTAKMLIKHNLTKLTEDELVFELRKRKDFYISYWNDVLDVDHSKRADYI